VAFLVPDLRREFGGCAGNIAYNLKLLGDEPQIMATMGEDHASYSERLDALGISRQHIRQVQQVFTAQAFITTDKDDNQITAFHPGAMNFSHLNHVSEAVGVEFGIVSPDGRDGMIQHAKEFVEAGVPFIFDPGQGLPMFNGEELSHFVSLADYVTVNDYEAELLQEKTGKTLEQIAKGVKALIVTLGAQGSIIFTGGKQIPIPCAKPSAIVDPTGCGDAFRAGLLYGLAHGMDWPITGRLASLLGALKIAQRGGQNHTFNRDGVASQFKSQFNISMT
jgi:adenosine kinase